MEELEASPGNAQQGKPNANARGTFLGFAVQVKPSKYLSLRSIIAVPSCESLF
jgi:hypothetical protein